MRSKANDPTFNGVPLAPTLKYPAVISPQLTLESVLAAVNQLKEVVEILIRLRGRTEDSAFTVADAVKIFDSVDQKIRRLAGAVLTNFVAISYGGLQGQDNATPALIPALGWITVPFDTGATTTPIDIAQDPATDSISINKSGTFFVSFSCSIEHTEINQSRNFNLRLYDVTVGMPADVVILVGIARNQDATLINWTFLFDMPESKIGNSLRVEVGNATNDIPITNWAVTEWSVFRVSEYKDTLI